MWYFSTSWRPSPNQERAMWYFATSGTKGRKVPHVVFFHIPATTPDLDHGNVVFCHIERFIIATNTINLATYAVSPMEHERTSHRVGATVSRLEMWHFATLDERLPYST